MGKEIAPLSTDMAKAAFAWVFGDDAGRPITSKTALAQYMGVSKKAVAQYFDNDAFQDEVDRLLKKAKAGNDREIVRRVPRALEVLDDIMMNASQARDRLSAAVKILAYAGYGENQTITVNVNDTTGVVRGGFGSRQIENAITVVETEYEVVQSEGEPDDES